MDLYPGRKVKLVNLDRDHALVIERYVGQEGQVIAFREDGFKFTTYVLFNDGYRGWFAEEELEEVNA